MAWIFWCADQEIHRSKRNKALPPCFQLMYVGPGTGKPYHVVSLQWSAMGEHFYGFGKEGDPIPTCSVKLTIFLVLGETKTWKEALISIILSLFIILDPHILLILWQVLAWQALRAETADQRSWLRLWIFWKRQSVLWRCYWESWWFFFKDLLWRQIHEVHVAPGTNMKFVICVKVPHTWLIDLVWEAEDCLLSQHIIVHLMECKNKCQHQPTVTSNIYRYI